MKRQSLSFGLATALAKGRAPGAHGSREKILVSLLSKRAAAQRAGLTGQEAMLREQILWSLPVRQPTDEDEDSTAFPNQ